jgi:hypothetical protein
MAEHCDYPVIGGRHTKNPAHRWLRQQVLEVCAPIAAL